MIQDNLSCNNCGDVTRYFSLHGGQIKLEHRRKKTKGKIRQEYEVYIRKSIGFGSNIDESRKIEIDSFSMFLKSL